MNILSQELQEKQGVPTWNQGGYFRDNSYQAAMMEWNHYICPGDFQSHIPTLGSFITLSVLLWLWAPLMGDPGVELVGRFILLLGLAFSFKALKLVREALS